jgi:hypothetical protein
MPKALTKFSLETMKDLDGGRATLTFDEQVKRAVLDCIDRPGEKRVRVVTLQMKITPVPVISGNTIDCDGVDAILQCRTQLPDHPSRQVNFGIKHDGSLIFNPDSPADHRQTTLVDDKD